MNLLQCVDKERKLYRRHSLFYGAHRDPQIGDKHAAVVRSAGWIRGRDCSGEVMAAALWLLERGDHSTIADGGTLKILEST